MTKYIIIILLNLPYLSIAQSTIKGYIYDYESLACIKFGTVALLQNGHIKKGVETDHYGYFEMNDIQSGKYEVEASYVGYEAKRIKCKVYEHKSIEIEITIKEGVLAEDFGCFPYYGYPPVFDFHDMTSGARFDTKDIKNMPIPR